MSWSFCIDKTGIGRWGNELRDARHAHAGTDAGTNADAGTATATGIDTEQQTRLSRTKIAIRVRWD
jgi:hypothetical protein